MQIDKLEIGFSAQANLLLDQMQLDRETIVNWYCHIRKINIGGLDIIEYLTYLKNLKIDD